MVIVTLPPFVALVADDARDGSRSCRYDVVCRIVRICTGVTLPEPPCDSKTNAARPAACGAAELVPEKFGLVSRSLPESFAAMAPFGKSDVFAASIAATRGISRVSGCGNRFASLSKKITAGPGDVKASGIFGRNTL